jgi:hypothetical protein
MTSEWTKKELADVHVRMWNHYDDLRQKKKNTTFLTANTILAAITVFSLEKAAQLVSAISAIGIVLGIAWFLLLTRNTAYIDYHREGVGEDWTPKSWTPHSSVLDRALPVAFGAFWVCPRRVNSDQACRLNSGQGL